MNKKLTMMAENGTIQIEGDSGWFTVKFMSKTGNYFWSGMPTLAKAVSSVFSQWKFHSTKQAMSDLMKGS